uniref:IFNe4 n=1 Tax=Polyodon spathula TaxID=7913 RepID=A0AAU7N356_POLSP
MSLQSLWVSCCIALLCCQFSLGCKWIQGGQYKSKSKVTLTLLKQMGEEILVHSTVPFRYTVPSHSQKEDDILVLYEAHIHIGKLYIRNRDNLTSVSWDREDLEMFQSVIHRQSVELRKCVEDTVQEEMTTSVDNGLQGNTNKRMKWYFKKLDAYLKSKNYTANAWEEIRTQIWKFVIQLDLLAAANRRFVE